MLEVVKEIPALALNETLEPGYPVIAMKEIHMNSHSPRVYIVIAMRPDHPVHPYAVWTVYRTASMDKYACERGTYCYTIQEAVAVFEERYH